MAKQYTFTISYEIQYNFLLRIQNTHIPNLTVDLNVSCTQAQVDAPEQCLFQIQTQKPGNERTVGV